MADKQIDLASAEVQKLVATFQGLESHEEKCRFFHDAANKPTLSRIFAEVHYPKPQATT